MRTIEYTTLVDENGKQVMVIKPNDVIEPFRLNKPYKVTAYARIMDDNGKTVIIWQPGQMISSLSETIEAPLEVKETVEETLPEGEQLRQALRQREIPFTSRATIAEMKALLSEG